MTIAIRKKIRVKNDGRIEILSPELRSGAMVEVIVLVEEDRQALVQEAKELYTLTQSLPQIQKLSEKEIQDEIDSHRSGN